MSTATSPGAEECGGAMPSADGGTAPLQGKGPSLP